MFTAVLSAAILSTAGDTATAQATSESIQSYNVDIEIRRDGNVHVREEIAYDFGSNERHGITRDIPVRFEYDEPAEGQATCRPAARDDDDFAGPDRGRPRSRYDRVYRLHDIRVLV